ncbi:MAG: stage II sporulation protein M [Methanosarcinales archaeon]
MIDKLLKVDLIKKNPSYGIALGIFFATIGLAFSTLIFKENSSFPAVFLTTLAAAPILIRVMEEEKIKKDFILNRHKKVIKIYSYLFFGMAIAFALWYTILPENFSLILFEEQTQKFAAGYFTEPTQTFLSIIMNNIGLLFFFFLLSLFYGSGSIFLLTWNASIMGVMWGNSIKATLALFNPSILIVNTLFALPYLFPEVLAYFIAAIAGGIVAVNLKKKQKLKLAMKDSLVLLGISIVMIVIAGVIETWILAI